MIAQDRVAGRSIRARVWQLTGVACATLVARSLVVAWNLEHSREASGWVEHTQTVLRELGTYTREIVDAETGQRGYLIMHQEVYLAPYHRALANNHEQFSLLDALITDENERTRLVRLARIMSQKLRELALTIDVAKSGHLEQALT